MNVRQAVVLVGGKGTRLGELTRNAPKPLLEVADGLRFLDVLLFDLARHGFSDILLLAGHLGDQVEDAYQGRQILDSHIRVLRETEPQGTGGALKFAESELEPWFLMTNGDSLFEINFREFTANLDPTAAASLALREVPDPARYGAVEFECGVVTAFREKNASLNGPAFINGGVYLINREIVSSISGPCSIEADVFPSLAAEGRLRAQAYDGYFLDIGLPDTYETARREVPQRLRRGCAFLDRDGVLNRDDGYTHRVEDLEWMPGAIQAVRSLNDAGYYVIVVSNQAGIARGKYTEADTLRFHGKMNEELWTAGAHIDRYYFCPFHAEAKIKALRHPNHPDRKPNPGLILQAMKDFDIVAERSFMIGDMETDIEAANRANIASALYVSGPLNELTDKMLRLSRGRGE